MVRRRVTGALLIALGCLVFMGSVQVNRGSDVYGGSGAAYFEPEVITTIVSTRLTYPNETVIIGDFDVVNASDDGSTIRYGHLSSASPDGLGFDYNYRQQGYPISYERGGASAPSRIPLFWLSLNGVKAGDKIIDAHIYLSNGYASVNATGDGYFAVRVDTVASDYTLTDYPSSTSDLCLLDACYSRKDITGVTDPWVPAIATRTSGWEYGIRSNDLHGFAENDEVVGNTNVFDITNAVQQIADKGQAAIDRGLLVFAYGINTSSSFYLVAGNYSSRVVGYGGNPALTITTSNKRGAKIWGTGKVPIVLTLDDSYPMQTDLFASLTPPDFNLATNNSNLAAWVDSLMVLHQSDIDFIYHGDTHVPWGTFSGAVLNGHLDHHAWVNSTNFLAMPDTAGMSAAYTAGTGAQYSFEVLYKLVGYSYKSCRSTNLGMDDIGHARVPIGWVQSPSWDGYTNIFALNAKNLGGIVGDTGIIEDKEEIRERLLRWVDWVYSDEGRGALLTYSHSVADYMTATNMATLVEIIEESDFMELWGYDDLIETMRARPLLDITDVVSATGAAWSASYADSVLHHRPALSAAAQDSFSAENDKDALFDLMWVGPAGGN